MKLPRTKFEGTQGEVLRRARERAQVMESRHPGTRFSLFVGNPLGIKLARKLGIPGAGMPQAIFNRNAEPVSNPEKIRAVLYAADCWKDMLTGYVAYTTLQQATGLSFEDIFGVCVLLRSKNPRAAIMSVNKLGANTVVKLRWPIHKPFMREK